MSTNTELDALAARAEAAQSRYRVAVAQIEAKRAQLADAMTDLQALGCPTLATADAEIERLQGLLDTSLSEIEHALS